MLGITRTQVNRRAAAGRLEYTSKLPGRTGAYLFDRATIVEMAGASC